MDAVDLEAVEQTDLVARARAARERKEGRPTPVPVTSVRHDGRPDLSRSQTVMLTILVSTIIQATFFILSRIV